MEGQAVKEIERISQEAAEIKVVDGKKYSVKEMHPVFYDPRPSALKIQSLTGIKDYIAANVDHLDIDSLMIHIVDHERVDVITEVHGDKNQRHTVLQANRDGKDFPFGEWIGQEDFIIKVRAMFEETTDRVDILHHTAKIDTESAIKTMDDGVKQNIQIKKGLSGALTESKEVKPIVTLKPCRTFAEIDQPESEFLFRMKDSGRGVACALFEADNAAWKNTARESIKEFLNETGVTIIA